MLKNSRILAIAAVVTQSPHTPKIARPSPRGPGGAAWLRTTPLCTQRCADSAHAVPPTLQKYALSCTNCGARYWD
jgi:hypothetical protein